MAMNLGGASAVKRKQYLLLGGLAALIAGVAVVAAMIGTSPAPEPQGQKKEEIVRNRFGTQEGVVKEDDLWRTKEGARVSQLNDEFKELKERLTANENARKADEERQRLLAAQAASAPRVAAPAPLLPPPIPAQPTAQGGQPGAQAGSPGQMPPRMALPAMAPGDQEVARGIMRIGVSGEGVVANASMGVSGADGQTINKSGARQTTENYIPTGTFLRGVNLAGLDAPTGGQVQQNPHPIVFRVLDLAILPNKFKADYQDCFITGNGYGDLSSERAYIRLDRLSCVAEDGAALDVGIKGFVSGEDGKAGMRGRLITKQGQVLANALLAGVASGIGQGFAQANTTYSTSALGSTSTVDPNKIGQVGLGTGISKAADKLAAYYIKLAESMFPVIEVDSGREVDLVITRGISIER